MFISKKKIYFDQVDPGGIIYFVEIFKLMHQTYEELLESFETEENYFDSEKFVLPIVHTEADYIFPLKLHDEIEIKVSVSELRESSFELSYSVEHSGRLAIKGKTVHVAVGKKDFKKVKLAGDLHAGLEKHLIITGGD